MYLVNRKGQLKKVKLLSDKFMVGDVEMVMTNVSKEPVKVSDLVEEKKESKQKFNCTQLNPDDSFERHIYHRDQFAHYLRWSHVLKNAKIGMTLLDFGSGTAELANLFYRNKYKPKKYVGLEYRQSTVDKNKFKFDKIDWAEFHQEDLTSPDFKPYGKFDVITSFEVIEHVGTDNADIYIQNLVKNANKNTTIYISTPVYDHNSGAADNHVVGNEVNEYTYDELEDILTRNGLVIEKTYGTFASIRDYKDHLTDAQNEVYEQLKEYYDTNMLSVIMAPMVPKHSRNTIWRCKYVQ